MRSILPANRVAALATWLTALGAFITAIEGTFPSTWQNTALAIAGVLGTLVTALHFMSGSQKFDALTAATQAASVVPESLDSEAWLKSREAVSVPGEDVPQEPDTP